jgi:murein L,D-transpeptidase YcbB/YkuD
MSELGGVLPLARGLFLDRKQTFLPCVVLAGTLLLSPFAPAWATPGDHNAEATVAAPAAQPASDPALTGAIRDLAGNGQALDQLVEFDPVALRQLYGSRNYEPMWVTSGGLQPAGEMLLTVLERLQRSGALPQSADIAAASAHRGGTAAAGLAEMELLLSSALARTAVDPKDLLAPGPHPQVLEAVAASDDGKQILPQWLPPDPTFWRLRAAIDGYRALADRGGWPSVNAGPKLEPGMRDGRIVQIRGGRRSRRQQRRIGCL